MHWPERLAGRIARAQQTASVRIACDELRRIRELTRTSYAVEQELAVLVAPVTPRLLAEGGCGVLIAAKLVGETHLATGSPGVCITAHPKHRNPYPGCGAALKRVD